MSPLKPPLRCQDLSNQRGFSLIELSVAFILVAGLVVSTFQILSYQDWIDKAKQQAEQIRSVNEAVQAYAGKYAEILSNKDLPSSCMTVFNKAVGAEDQLNAAAVEAAPDTCKRSKDKDLPVDLNNVMQPSLDELKQLKLLDINRSYAPVFATEKRVVTKGANGNIFLSSGYSVLITRVCVPSSSVVETSSKYCKTQEGNPGYYDLKTLVYNSQPFNDKNIKFGATNMLYTVLKKAGDNAYIAADGLVKVSNESNPYPLVASNSNGDIDNPLKDTGGKSIKNIIAIAGGYYSSWQANYLRQDGGNSMLAKLDMANNDIVNAKNISAASLSTAGDITGFKFVVNKLLNMNNNDIVDAKNISAVNLSTTNGIQAANISATESVVGNTISGFTFVVNKVLNMNNNDIVAAKNISAAGLSTTGDITTAATQKLETGYLKLQGTAGENNACGSGFTNSLSLDASDPNKLLRCDGSKWVTMTQKGATGDTGATGATGPPGAKNFGTNTEGGTCTSVNELSLNSANPNYLLRCDGNTNKWVAIKQKGTLTFVETYVLGLGWYQSNDQLEKKWPCSNYIAVLNGVNVYDNYRNISKTSNQVQIGEYVTKCVEGYLWFHGYGGGEARWDAWWDIYRIE